MAKGYDLSVAEELFAWIVKFSNYGFPKGHAVAYSKIAYQLAYLKSHFTVYFYAELLSSTTNQPDKLHLYLKEMKESGIQLLPPAVNKSFGRYTVENGHIRIGLLGIKGISNKTVQEIIKARGKKKFTSLSDFYLRVSGKAVSRGAMEILIMAGAFDEIYPNRASVLASIDRAMEQGELFKEFADQPDLFAEQFPLEESYVEMEDFSLPKKLADEKELLGMYVSSHPLKSYRHTLDNQGYIPLAGAERFAGQKNRKAVAIVQQIRKIRTKRGESMAFIVLADETDEIDAVIFPDLYREHGNWLEEEAMVKVTGKVEWRRTNLQWVISRLEPFHIEEVQTDSKAVLISIRVVDRNGRETMQFLKKIMEHHPGQTPVKLVHDQQTYHVKNCLLAPDPACIAQLHSFFW
ncbi:OB-fold nucleic acid binding domain-containing protein [Virgibacillus halophilus]|uniref:OB-fold nucleic acid binding domain-containing protein n=1 Tax=Tigheibacillus halophilus TaxID=361280 RepID=A0ABU5CCB5_9BACI|nr:OB-fold nucleic acid binding domain-containing protein [Virgibacillus halophilus]